MKERLAKLIDLKSIITFLLVVTLVFLVIYGTVKGGITDPLFLLFSNVITMTITYFFTKKKEPDSNDN